MLQWHNRGYQVDGEYQGEIEYGCTEGKYFRDLERQ